MNKNGGQYLPLSDTIKRVAVIGPHADWEEVMWGNYNGVPSSTSTIIKGIRNHLSEATEVHYARGCGVIGEDRSGFDDAVKIAQKSDVAILCLGLSQVVEGEEGQQEGLPEGEKALGDRADIFLPGVQEDLLKVILEE